MDIDLEEDTTIQTGETPDDELEVPVGLEDEDISLDLKTLDLDIEESDTIKDGDTPEDNDIDMEQPSGEVISEENEITLDLESMDIPLDENEETRDGEKINDDEKLTLEDAGLTFDELTSDEISSMTEEHEYDSEDEDIRLTIDEIDPDLDINKLDEELESEKDLSDTSFDDDDIPEVDFNDMEETDFHEPDAVDIAAATTASIAATPKLKIDDNLMDIDVDNDYQINEQDKKGSVPYIIQKGTVNFSFDYSLSYSKPGAILRLLCMFLIGMIPHFVVFMVYSILSFILATLNNIVVISTGKPVDDFLEIQENTLRYYLSINASLLGIIEEMPIFTGKDDIDYSLQMNITYSLRYSKLFAALRLSIIGMTIICLPHLVVIAALGLTMPFIFLAGLISVLITGTWPQPLFNFLTRYYRFTTKVLAFTMGLIDVYPPFKFE